MLSAFSFLSHGSSRGHRLVIAPRPTQCPGTLPGRLPSQDASCPDCLFILYNNLEQRCGMMSHYAAAPQPTSALSAQASGFSFNPCFNLTVYRLTTIPGPADARSESDQPCLFLGPSRRSTGILVVVRGVLPNGDQPLTPKVCGFPYVATTSRCIVVCDSSTLTGPLLLKSACLCCCRKLNGPQMQNNQVLFCVGALKRRLLLL